MSDLFSPAGGWRVRILDLSGGAEEGISEEIGGFPNLMHANEFARRYVRDSIERCRAPGMDAEAVLEAWQMFGEDAEIVDGGEAAWQSASERDNFAHETADSEQRNWRVLDPRRLGEDDEAYGTSDAMTAMPDPQSDLWGEGPTATDAAEGDDA